MQNEQGSYDHGCTSCRVPVRLGRILYDERVSQEGCEQPIYRLALITGAGVAIQSLINARLRVVLGGPFWAAIGQFIVGLLLLILLAVVTRQPAPTFGECRARRGGFGPAARSAPPSSSPASS